MDRRQSIIAFALAAVTATAVQPVSAQSVLLPSTPEKGVWVEATHTRFKGFEASLPTTVWYVSGRVPLTSRIRAVVDVPFSHARLDIFGEGEQASSVVGNPYLGLEFAARSRVRLELGARAPLNTGDEESFADVIAFVADPLRPEAFMDEVVPVSAGLTFQQTLPAGLALRARGGVTTLFHTGKDTSDPESAIDYGVLGSYTAGPAQVGIGVSGRWYATSDDGNVAETSLHHAGLSADVRLGRVRPGISGRVPLDREYRQVVKSSVGVYLQVPLR
jgi:hypothetical protein